MYYVGSMVKIQKCYNINKNGLINRLETKVHISQYLVWRCDKVLTLLGNVI